MFLITQGLGGPPHGLITQGYASTVAYAYLFLGTPSATSLDGEVAGVPDWTRCVGTAIASPTPDPFANPSATLIPASSVSQ